MSKRLHIWLFYLAFVVATPSPILWYHAYAQKPVKPIQASVLSFPAAHWERREISRRQLQKQENDAILFVEGQLQQSIAVVGEIYRPIRAKHGDVPSIQKPLQKAKRALALRDYDKARGAIRQSWRALKAHHPTSNQALPWLLTAKK